MNYWNTPFYIRSYAFNRFVAGPLDGVTNRPFRQTVRLFSPAALMYTEICHCDTIVCRDPKNWGLQVGEEQINFQMSASDTRYIARACECACAAGVRMVDINVGCPAKSVVRNGAGSALLADVPRLKAVITLFRACLTIPLTVKMRAGFKDCNARDVACMLEDLGIDAVCIHPRLQSQGFSGDPDYKIVADIKRRVGIPVLVSGGITNSLVARSVYEVTGADGFLIGRALVGRPWLLRQLEVEACGGRYEVDRCCIQDTMIRHLGFSCAWFGPSRGLAYFKKHLKEYAAQLGLSGEDSVRLLASTSVERFYECWYTLKDAYNAV
jgi:tRNA-dihydrouridine synthase B